MRLTRIIARINVSKTVWIALACSIMPAPGAAASTLWASPGLGNWLREVDVATGALGPDAAPNPNAFFADLAGARHLHGDLVWGVSTDNSGVNRLHALNPKGAQIVSSVTIAAPVQQRIGSLAIDPVTGEFYGASPTSLYRIAPATGAIELVGPTGVNIASALGFDLLGNLFGVGSQRELVSVNKTTGATTSIAILTIFNVGDIAARPETGVMYAIGNGVGAQSGYNLYQVDLVSGALSYVGLSLTRANGLAFAAVPEPTSALAAGAAALMIPLFRIRRRNAAPIAQAAVCISAPTR